MKLYAIKQTVRKYYKYVDTPWIQPVATGNYDNNPLKVFGELGGNNFAVLVDSYWDARVTAYRMFEVSTSWWQTASGTSHFVEFYNPNPLKVSNISITNISASGYNSTGGTVYGSSDGITWTTIKTFTSITTVSTTWNIDLSSNTNVYKYYKVDFTSPQQMAILNFNVTAIQQTAVEATQDDYDFYKDEEVYKLIKANNKYYACMQGGK